MEVVCLPEEVVYFTLDKWASLGSAKEHSRVYKTTAYLHAHKLTMMNSLFLVSNPLFPSHLGIDIQGKKALCGVCDPISEMINGLKT